MYKYCSQYSKNERSYTVAEEIIIPLIKEVIETVMKKEKKTVLKYLPLSANRQPECIDETAGNMERINFSF